MASTWQVAGIVSVGILLSVAPSACSGGSSKNDGAGGAGQGGQGGQGGAGASSSGGGANGGSGTVKLTLKVK